MPRRKKDTMPIRVDRKLHEKARAYAYSLPLRTTVQAVLESALLQYFDRIEMQAGKDKR